MYVGGQFWGKVVGGEDGADAGEAHEFGQVAQVDGRVEFFGEGGEHGGHSACQQRAPKEVDTFQVLRVGDDHQVAGPDAELVEGAGGLADGRSKRPPRNVNIRLVRCHVDDRVLAVVRVGEGVGVQESVV